MAKNREQVLAEVRRRGWSAIRRHCFPGSTEKRLMVPEPNGIDIWMFVLAWGNSRSV